jgi:hypothetical protein
VQEWIGRSSPGKNVDGEVGGSGVNAAVVLAVSETSGHDDGVQEEMVKMMVCRTWIFASCISEEVWPESVGAEVLSWAWLTVMPGEVSGLRCSYQGM